MKASSTSTSNARLRWSTEEVERRRREKAKVLAQYISPFRGGQVHIVQWGAYAVRILGEIEEACVEDDICVLRVMRVRQRRRDRLEPWQLLTAVTRLEFNVRMMGELEWGSSRLGFAYIDDGELKLDRCHVALHLQCDPVDPWQ